MNGSSDVTDIPTSDEERDEEKALTL
ncbi:hypothetical protein NPIL_232461, partial [Nephila pilipes]